MKTVQRLMLVCVLCAAAACGGKEAETPLPTKQKTIDPVNQKLDAVQDAADKQKEAIDRASGTNGG